MVRSQRVSLQVTHEQRLGRTGGGIDRSKTVLPFLLQLYPVHRELPPHMAVVVVKVGPNFELQDRLDPTLATPPVLAPFSGSTRWDPFLLSKPAQFSERSTSHT